MDAIYNDNALPAKGIDCLSDEELVLRSAAGDELAVEEIISRFVSVVRYLARPYFLAGGDAEDLVQEGMIGLLKAIRSFDPRVGVLFRTFAATCIKSKLLSALKNAL
ncbi:MAG: sigma-70 family RNA polymerase sigma factor, partial [Clostridia bacterium]